MNDEERKTLNERRREQRHDIQDRVYDMISSTARQTQRVLDRLEEAGVEVPEELGDQLYGMAMSQLDHQTQMLASVQKSADEVLDRYWRKRRGASTSTDDLQLVTRKKGDTLVVDLPVENPSADPIAVALLDVDCADERGVKITALPLGASRLAPGDRTVAKWVVSTDGADPPTLVRFTVGAKTDLATRTRTYELTVL